MEKLPDGCYVLYGAVDKTKGLEGLIVTRVKIGDSSTVWNKTYNMSNIPDNYTIEITGMIDANA